MPSSKPTEPSLWETKARVEAQFPDFPHIDISAQDFDQYAYRDHIREILRESGLPLHPISVTWRDLTCSVPQQPPNLAVATVISGISSAFSAIRNGFSSVLYPRSHTKETLPDAIVLDGATGYLRPGDMCLVLGSSGSGTSLLLSRIAGRRPPRLIDTSGEVLYDGLRDRLGGIVLPSHFVHYIDQEDVHLPTLTVRQNLMFAAECKWPAWVPFVDTIRTNDVILTARALGIERTLDTIVGNNILRGVSGGERKRVTIGEMVISQISGLLVMDNWSKGLDAATTLSITRSMRVYADNAGPVIVSMQAPGTETFNIFDNLCLLHEGKVAYFGPLQQAERYLRSLGFKRPKHRSVPDFVATVFDQSLRSEYVSGDDDHLAPRTGQEFSEAFQKSEFARHTDSTINELNAEAATRNIQVPERLVKLASRSTVQRPRAQLGALFRRQLHYISSIRANLFADLAQNLIFGLILGSIFWQLPETQGGAGSRSGAVFLAMLFIGLSAISKVAERFDEKHIFVKQRASSFFDAWTYLLNIAAFDLVFELLKAACLFVPMYIMGGLNLGSSAQRLLYAIILAAMVSMIMVSMTRFLVGAFDDTNAAQGVAGLLTITFVLFSGYLKNGSNMDGWLVWIYWADPLHYALEALLINEFDGLTLSCPPGDFSLIPRGAPEALRICPVSTGKVYLESNLGITNGAEYRAYYFLVVLGYTTFFFILSAMATALSRPKGFALRSSMGEPQDTGDHVSVDVDLKEDKKADFTFTHTSYSVEDGNKVLLTDVTGNATAGKVVLLMGESGAGKTTLLDVLAMRKTLSHGTQVSGEVRLNGTLLDKETLANVSGYCEQNDLHIGEATVYEAVLFSAKLRLPAEMTLHEKKRRTQETVEMLGLQSYRNILVKVLGSGELKLLTMALEVVADPVVLFLDEPTSGISSSSSMIVAKALRRIAGSGKSVICTVHQPSAEVFTMFDRILLLKRGGKTVYFGDIGKYGGVMREYFEARCDMRMKTEDNPAAWMLDVIADSSVDWVAEWNSSQEKQERDAETVQLAADGDSSHKIEYSPRPKLGVQSREVIRRQFWRYWRLPEYNVTRVMLLFMIAVLVGLLFLREIDDTQAGASLAFAALFLTVIPASLSAQNVIEPTVGGRAVYYRETAAGTYKPLAQNMAVGIVELPFTVVASTVFSVVFYFLVGLDPSRFFYFFLAVQLLYIMAVMFGVMMSTLLPTAAIAANLASAVISMLTVLSGFFIRKPEMPVWWSWTVWINPFSYFLSGVVVNQMADQKFVCKPNELVPFPFPKNSTVYSSCAEIPGGEFFDNFVNGTLTSCLFCPIPDGQTLIDNFEADDVSKWIGLVAILVAILICRLVAGYGFAKVRYLSR